MIWKFTKFVHFFFGFQWSSKNKWRQRISRFWQKLEKKQNDNHEITYQLQNDGSRRLLGVISWGWNWDWISDGSFGFLYCCGTVSSWSRWDSRDRDATRKVSVLYGFYKLPVICIRNLIWNCIEIIIVFLVFRWHRVLSIVAVIRGITMPTEKQ